MDEEIDPVQAARDRMAILWADRDAKIQNAANMVWGAGNWTPQMAQQLDYSSWGGSNLFGPSPYIPSDAGGDAFGGGDFGGGGGPGGPISPGIYDPTFDPANYGITGPTSFGPGGSPFGGGAPLSGNLGPGGSPPSSGAPGVVGNVGAQAGVTLGGLGGPNLSGQKGDFLGNIGYNNPNAPAMQMDYPENQQTSVHTQGVQPSMVQPHEEKDPELEAPPQEQFYDPLSGAPLASPQSYFDIEDLPPGATTTVGGMPAGVSVDPVTGEMTVTDPVTGEPLGTVDPETGEIDYGEQDEEDDTTDDTTDDSTDDSSGDGDGDE